MTDKTEPPIDFETAKRWATEQAAGSICPCATCNHARAYLSLADEAEQWRSDPLVAGAVEVRRKAGLADPEVLALRAENAALRKWVKDEGERAQMCTYAILKEACPTGRCCEKRRTKTRRREKEKP